MRTRNTLAALVSTLVVLSACSSSSDKPSPEAAKYADYVALGDSYSAGPLIAPTVKEAPALCLRSQANYPGFLSSYLKVKKLTDVTCSGATTSDLYSSQSVRMGLPQNPANKTPPQLDALSSKTDLVTLGMGANDFSEFGKTFASLTAGEGIPPGANQQVQDVEKNLEIAIDAIAKRAPHARIMVIGYLRIAPDSGTCKVFPFSPAKSKIVNQMEQQLNGALEDAAKAKGATYVDSYTISTGHDVCAGDAAWVNGVNNIVFKAAFLHPFLEGMNGVARQIYLELTSEIAPKDASNGDLRRVPRTVAG